MSETSIVKRREFTGTICTGGLISLAGCASTETGRPEEFNSIELREKRIRSDYTKWVIAVEIDENSDAYYIEHQVRGWRDRRENLPENQYSVEFPVVSHSDDSYSSAPSTGHNLVLIDGDEEIGSTEVNFKERISVSDPGFMSTAHGRQDTAGNWISRAGGGHTGFTFSVINKGDFPVQIASAAVKGDIAKGPGPVSDYWPTAVWFRDEDGSYDFESHRFDDDDVHSSLMLAPGESSRIGAMGYNVSDSYSLCDGSTRKARVIIKTLNKYGVKARFKYRLSGQKDAGGCTEGEIMDFEVTNHFS